MEVDVKHRLTGTRSVILHDTKPRSVIPLFTGDLAPLPESIADQRVFLRGHVQAVDKMYFRQQKKMQRRLWGNILDNEQLIVLEHLF